MSRLAVLLLFVAAACGSEPAASAPAAVEPPPPAPRVDASDLIAKYECARCHEVPDVTVADDKSCVRCHQQIHAGTFTVNGAPVEAATLSRWQRRITSLRWVPSLAHAGRLRRGWVQAYLLSPHDVRPGLVAQMPRLALVPEEAARLAAHFVPEDDAPTPVSGDRARGELLFAAKACSTCHRFSGTAADRTNQLELSAAVALAPDLRHTRDRMTRAQIASWITSPRGAMPALGLGEEDARALAAFIATTPLAPAPLAPAPLPPQRLPVLAREVTWAEVEARVFRDTCWHCHAEPDYARGDGGPGNTGGFGFAGRGLDMSSYAAISAGSLDYAGERRSVFARLPDGTPRLVAHLLARHVEVAGGTVPGIRGMPLGLPPVPLETIQLVDTWIAQGRPR
jgi:mono/diheme cytochrome c family protein